jgi:DNA cross-link repair 1A protein
LRPEGTHRAFPKSNDCLLVTVTNPYSRLGTDTLFYSSQHAFPKQTEMLKNVRDAVLAENHNPKVLFLFGTYTIGKEKVFFTAAEALQKKLYVGKQKKKVLDALGDCLTIEERGLITSDDTATNLHVVPMGSTSFDRMKLIKKYYKNRYDTIVAFKPTGWTFTQTKKNDRGTKRSKRGQLIQYAVPYSEHSSFSELRELVKFLQPRAIMPHVGNDRGEKARRMVRYLTLSDEELAGELEA